MKGKAKASALTPVELAERNANTRKRRRGIEHETHDVIVVILSSAPK